MHKTSRRPGSGKPAERKLFEVINNRFEPLEDRGGGGVVLIHLALDRKTGAKVAIKRLRTELLSNLDAHYAMETEAKALSLASHPGIPKLIDHSLAGSDPYIAEEFKRGVQFSLNNLTKTPDILSAGIYICGILSALHRAGIVHRDLKPPNLILGFDGRSVSLIDYGFSIVPGMQDFAMRVDVQVGTPMFMAPEQTYPYARVDHRADIYSLAVILYSYLSGWYPYASKHCKATTDEYFHMHRHQQAAPLHLRKPSLGQGISKVIARALEKDPNKRFQSAEGFADALSGCLSG